jgi:hypothetical protein
MQIFLHHYSLFKIPYSHGAPASLVFHSTDLDPLRPVNMKYVCHILRCFNKEPRTVTFSKDRIVTVTLCLHPNCMYWSFLAPQPCSVHHNFVTI